MELNIDKLGAGPSDGKIGGITVIWVARKKGGGIYVVGYYKNATVYREVVRTGKFLNPNAEKVEKVEKWYRIEAKAEDCFCEDEKYRTLKVDFFKGQAAVFYKYDSVNEPDFDKKLIKLLENGKSEIESDVRAETRENYNRKYGKGGEGEKHKALKEYASKNPQIFGMPGESEVKTEYPLPSGDSLDVLFKNNNHWTAVEVKSSISNFNDKDIKRGIYQCVKYRAVLNAMAEAENTPETSEVFLFLEDKNISEELKVLARILSITIKFKR
ncbi:MAG: hypothetical protein ACR2P5_08935 [Gammaproteobacteria bacterium]